VVEVEAAAAVLHMEVVAVVEALATVVAVHP
jgi:hypothetical protein